MSRAKQLYDLVSDAVRATRYKLRLLFLISEGRNECLHKG